MSKKPTSPGKPPPLPKLPRSTKSGGLPRLSKSGTSTQRLPKVKREPDEFVMPEPDETSKVKGGFGGTETGRWFETGQEAGQVGGRCWKCGRLRKAENLVLYMRPFGKGEVWICKGGCR